MDDPRKRLIELAAGVYVESDVLGIVERIQEYDPNLRIQVLDPSSRDDVGDAPYRLVERCPDGIDRVVFGIWDLDARVLERLYAADTRKHDILGRIDQNNSAQREKEKRRYKEDVLGEAKDQAVSILKSPRGSYTLPGIEDGTQIVMDSHEPVAIKSVKSGLKLRRE